MAWTVSSLAGRSAKILEIGSFEGRSAFLWRRLFPDLDSKLVCMDLWPMKPPHENAQALFYQHTEPLRASGFLVKTFAGSPSSESLMQLAAHEEAAKLAPFDVIYIDGAHSAETVLSDIVMADAILRPGGLMLLDDFEWEGVQRAAHAFLAIKQACCYEVTHAARQLHLKKVRDHRPDGLGNGSSAGLHGKSRSVSSGANSRISK